MERQSCGVDGVGVNSAVDPGSQDGPKKSVTSFFNPATDTTYRLVVSVDGTWRISKSRSGHGNVVIRNLRGITGPGEVDPSLIDRLIRGEKEISPGQGDPIQAFAVTVLTDLDRTYHLLVAVAHEAHQRLLLGAPGFRPNSPKLKQDARETMAIAAESCRGMALAWQASGLVGEPLEWFASAVEGSESKEV